MGTLRSRPGLRLRSSLPALLVSLLLIFGLVAISLGLRPSAAPPVRPVIVLSGDWEPYTGPGLPDGGPVVSLMTDVLQLAGFQPEVRFTTWSSAEQRAARGTTFGAFPLVSSADRRDKLLFSDPLLDFEYVLFVRSDSEPLTSASELGRQQVGGIDGYDYWPELEDAAPGMVRYPSTREGMQALVDGDIDVLVEGLLSGETVLDDPEFAADATAVQPLDVDEPWARSSQSLYFVMPATDEARDVMADLNGALAQFKQSQEYADLLSALERGEYERARLLPSSPTGLVELRDATDQLLRWAPQGTTATVLEWPDLTSQPAARPGRSLIRVKIANGPETGRIYYVRSPFVELIEP